MVALLAGCDAVPGAAPLDQRPPVLSDLVFSPQVIVAEQVPELVSGDLVRIPLDLDVLAQDPDGDLDEVRFVVQSPRVGQGAVAEGQLAANVQGRYQTRTTLDIPKAFVGLYTVIVYAVDRQGQISNEVRGMLRFEATGKPPVLEAVDLPETVERPAPGEPPVLIPIVATVSDEDGLSNILRVEMRVGATVLLLCDDGPGEPCGSSPNSGDEVAGDGRFTLTVQLESTNSPGPVTFDFQAFDRAGLSSEILTRTINVE